MSPAPNTAPTPLSPAAAVVRDLCRALLAFRSESAVLKLAEQFVARWPRLDAAERRSVFDVLLREFGPDVDEVRRAYEHAAAERFSPASLAPLSHASEARRQELFRRINMAPGGTATMVRLRAELLVELKERPELSAVEADLAHLLRSWFNRGFLRLERISWESPAAILERLVEYEAVHAIRSWVDLRRRLASDRRCYGFFHPALPGEPLIFIEIALQHGWASNVQAILDQSDPVLPGPPDHVSRADRADIADTADTADTAIFYSITNCQAGLAGIAFGDLLIKQVAETIGRELPQITHYATLSPVPGFGRWIAAQRAAPTMLSDSELDLLACLDSDGWQGDPAVVELLRTLTARFLVKAKSGRQPSDPVARFHLRNGAFLARVHALADTSAKGLAESHTVMVSYEYDEAQLMDNHEAFLADGTVACSSEVAGLAR